MRPHHSTSRHALLLAGAFTGALMLMPTIGVADPDDHPAATQQKMDNARDRLEDRKENIGQRKDMRMDRAEDRFQDKKENIRDQMSGAGAERRETLRNHMTNVKDRYQDRRDTIRDKAEDARQNARSNFRDRKEDIKDRDSDRDRDPR